MPSWKVISSWFSKLIFLKCFVPLAAKKVAQDVVLFRIKNMNWNFRKLSVMGRYFFICCLTFVMLLRLAGGHLLWLSYILGYVTQLYHLYHSCVLVILGLYAIYSIPLPLQVYLNYIKSGSHL